MADAPVPDRPDLASALPPVSMPTSNIGWTLFGIVMLVVAVGGLGAWAATTRIDSAVVAHGKVAVASKRKVIQHLEGGIIQKIAVRDGDTVHAGDVLIEFDPTRVRTRFAIVRSGYMASLAAEARLTAERDGRSVVTFPDELMAEAARDPEIAGMVRSQNQIFETRKQEHLGQAEILNSRIERLREGIVGFKAERSAAEQQLEMAKEELLTLEDLFRRQHTTRTRVLAARREVFQLEGSLGRRASDIASAEKEIGETDLTIAQTRNKFMTEVASELKATQAKVLEQREQYLSSLSEIDRLVLRAQSRGTVFGSQVHTIGGVARPGETLLEIVPDDDELIIEVRLRPQDVDVVSVGQETEVRFSAFNQRIVPTVNGQLSFVSADTLADPRDSSHPYYLANIEVKVVELKRLGIPKLQPGMPCDVMIKTGQRTPMDYLTRPLIESFHRAWRES
jgi:HlyD family type I secretion membrane fusion protein